MAATGWTVRVRWKKSRSGRVEVRPRAAFVLRPGSPGFWALALVVAVAAALVLLELETSRLQAKLFTAAASRLSFTVEPGPSPAIRYPESGPYAQRLGYARLETFTARLATGYDIDAQARSSDTLLRFMGYGLPALYSEKNQAGLLILDRSGEEMYGTRFPARVYASFDEIPPLVIQSLLFIESRRHLDEERPYANPAVEWVRLNRAFVDLGVHAIDRTHPVSGGSTIATQLEKLRHSPGGRTGSTAEKARQMLSASLRAYRGGERTVDARRQVLLDYLNSLPLGAIAGHGEVVGLGDGLWAWYGADFTGTNRLLREASFVTINDPQLIEHAVAYRQVLSLLLAIKRPSSYLPDGQPRLDARTDGYLRTLARAEVIPGPLAAAALEAHVQPRRRVSDAGSPSFLDRKATNAVRFDLLRALGVRDLYDLDRLDLSVRTTLDRAADERVTAGLRRLAGRESAASAGLLAPRLLSRGDPAAVVYSLTLYERGDGVNRIRLQTDTFDGPFDVNDGTRLELGSTAKLRTLATYLDIVASLHAHFAGMPDDERNRVHGTATDRLTRWVLNDLSRNQDRTLSGLLEAAMRRSYSASPAETFFTGGGVHRFSNFEGAGDGRVMTVREAFQRSVNLVFIRLMRDLVEYHTAQTAGDTTRLLDDRADPRRQAYLERFADREGRLFLRRFYRTYHGLSLHEAMETLAGNRPSTPRRLSILFRSVRPEASLDDLETFLRDRGLRESRRAIDDLFRRADPAALPLGDRAHLAGVHPLALWLVTYLQQAPLATFADAIAASEDERRQAYDWLFRTVSTQAQNLRIRTVLEEDAFREIHRTWRRQGYPFALLVPSLATALGSSGDSPAALAELVGIIVNDGRRLPGVRVEGLRFAAGTPFETSLVHRPSEGEQVLLPDVAALLRQELVGVVQHGTGRRLAGVDIDGQPAVIGGKTGTGDNRFETTGVLNRTAAFVFTIGDRHFGTILAYVPGPAAADYRFTSSLPVHVLRELLPDLSPLLSQPETSPPDLHDSGTTDSTPMASAKT